MDPRHAVLFEPIQIGPKTLPNRFYQVPHASGFGSVKPRTQAAFRGIKAEGGWGGVCTDYAPVSPDSDETFAVASDCWDADDMRRLGLVADAVHEHGALAGIELYHGGTWSMNGESRLPRMVPSQIASDSRYGSMAAEMTLTDIRRLQDAFVTAAIRARDVGFDIVYIYGAHGYLMTQMLSPVTNRRTDAYGGSLENRVRFQREILERVREEIGDDTAIAVRMALAGGDELVGIETDEMLDVIALLDPYVDLFDVNCGGWPEDSGTSRYFAEGHTMPIIARVKEVTSTPVVAVGRFTNIDLMAKLVGSGQLDIIGAARPAIADPFLPTKVREGRTDEIRECTGSNVCILKEETFHQIGCLQNPTAGEEFRRGWHPELFARPRHPEAGILVVGGGPAGLECAMVLGRRGFEAVHLVEAQRELGGKLRWTRQLPTLGDWGRVIDHRLVGLSKLDNVHVVTGRRLTAADVLDYGAEIVIVATGSHWCGDGSGPPHLPLVSGAEHALTPEQVMAGQRPEGRSVIVYDTDGYYVGPGIAELLRGDGYDVRIVTHLPAVSPVSDDSLEGDFLRAHLHGLGIGMTVNTHLLDIGKGHVTGCTGFGEEVRFAADAVVLVTQQVSDDRLFHELRADPQALAAAGIRAVHRIGDAHAPRMPSEAVFDGHRLAREIESDDPDIALPWRRERVRV